MRIDMRSLSDLVTLARAALLDSPFTSLPHSFSVSKFCLLSLRNSPQVCLPPCYITATDRGTTMTLDLNHSNQHPAPTLTPFRLSYTKQPER